MIYIHEMGRQPYLPIWERMKHFTETRSPTTPDQVWLLEHDPVYTQGQAGKAEHLLDPGDIPVVQADRGGQITYHGPGQLVAYCLLDLKRRQLSIRDLVTLLEKTLIALLAEFNLLAVSRREAPGVYIDHQKIASIGLRVKKHCAYHGLALNVKMDLSPFQRINPCGFAQLQMTQLSDYLPHIALQTVTQRWIHHFMTHFEGSPLCSS